jgi:phosphoenolpyruvate carboxykinase (GTP)
MVDWLEFSFNTKGIPMASQNTALNLWVDSVAALTGPTKIHWCTGTEEEYQLLIKQMLADGTLLQLNSERYPNCYLHRSHPSDVARTEHLTFVCTPQKEDAGPNNNWMLPVDGHKKIDALFVDCMKGRTLYVVPYCMGPIDSPHSRCGVEITDSPYVVANMKIMTRMGTPALDRIEKSGSFVKGLHSIGDLDINRRFVMHFPEELTIKSIGSGYGGNALLGKKCHALRIGSFQARREGWLAEHMLIVGIENPQGERTYVAAAFPSACGKTNLAMLIPPASYKGWKVWTVGDDIAWMHVGSDGRLYAINPEAGFFGVVPGTSTKTNPNALTTIQHDTIFTNVALMKNGEPWWEGLDERTPDFDWQGQPFVQGKGPAAHPNSRFTVSAKQCPSYTPAAEDSEGVPISAIIFGGRRPHLVPLVYESKSWAHGVMVGASVASETTAAATGAVGVLRRDSMAMKPFCGYNFADYWSHWLSFASRSDKLPKIFHVNWFRQDEKGTYMWPGFGDNMRVLEWILARTKNQAPAVRTPIGYVPEADGLNTEGLSISASTLQSLCAIDPQGWKKEMKDTEQYLLSYGDRLPAAFRQEMKQIIEELDM